MKSMQPAAVTQNVIPSAVQNNRQTNRAQDPMQLSQTSPLNTDRDFYNSKMNYSQSLRKNEERERFGQGSDFAKTSSLLCGINFKHHDEDNCVCDMCTCGRHLCKVHVIRPDFKKSSHYQQEYTKKFRIPNQVPINKGGDLAKGPHLDMKTMYGKEHIPMEGDKITRPGRPNDDLAFTGPSNMISSYGADYPGFKGPNPYIPIRDSVRRGQFSLDPRTTYSKAFPSRETSPTKLVPIKHQGNLKIGSPWMGSTTYGSNFKSPNPQAYKSRQKPSNKLNNSPNYGHQFETTYKNDFFQKKVTVCPAKIHLQTKISGLFTQKKDKFAQNSDFKALSPEFQAIATSKHFYV